MPKISVIMGVYNCKSFDALEASVTSIINQTFNDWEFIICNDGSTNETLEVLKNIEEKDGRIKVITYKKNQGLAYALNECIKVSAGDFIARQDDDDVSDIHRFEKEMKYFESHPDISIVGCTASVFDTNGTWGKFSVPANPKPKDFFWNSPFIHPSVIIKKADLQKAGCYRISKETRRCEDYDLFMTMYSLGMRGHNIQEELYRYCIINGNNKHRPMKYRIDEAKVRYIGYKKMGLLFYGLPYIAKPIIIGLMPQKFFKKVTKKQYA
ncbi:glycosyltransferase [Paenibacillus roseipurpureus]|uniref:Glycosyltransferase n=1 Tax=Paenibacillus roseopurpureus TaxID=2918901 RepID=A0AA96LLU3_9BACL|nr:glycosyltransferase [Paenibacillus sp. MBLB1832]WNR43512.1 glycosyltransferase [Paenibacillus sp. MBLB1832]